MNMRDIIIAKRDKHSLSDEQIKFFVKGVTDGTIPDYQTSALLMAIVLNGMDEREMTTLTLEMAGSGKQNDLSYLDGIPVDKHSTGGVGDKITPLLLPLLCRLMPGPEPHVNTASRWEVQATRRVTILYIYEQWKVFPHLPPKSKVCFSSFNLQMLKIVLFKGLWGCTLIAQHAQSSWIIAMDTGCSMETHPTDPWKWR